LKKEKTFGKPEAEKNPAAKEKLAVGEKPAAGEMPAAELKSGILRQRTVDIFCRKCHDKEWGKSPHSCFEHLQVLGEDLEVFYVSVQTRDATRSIEEVPNED
jgi:hypothetical protein